MPDVDVGEILAKATTRKGRQRRQRRDICGRTTTLIIVNKMSHSHFKSNGYTRSSDEARLVMWNINLLSYVTVHSQPECVELFSLNPVILPFPT